MKKRKRKCLVCHGDAGDCECIERAYDFYEGKLEDLIAVGVSIEEALKQCRPYDPDRKTG